MRGFLVKEGTEIKVAKFNGYQTPTIDTKVTNKESMYFVEDIIIDPLGNVGVGPQHIKTVGSVFARQGYYGFKLPKNKSGYETMLVHMNDITVI